MAAPAPNSVAALAANNPFGGDRDRDHVSPGTCLDDPNFATICSFIEKFGDIVRIGQVPFDELQLMLENNADVQLHIIFLRRVFKTVTPDKWERSLAKFGHTYCSQDAWEIERFGYKKAKIQTKLRLLKNLLEAQFDCNVKFKSEVNKLQAADLRLTPLGRDTEGQVYWYQVDADADAEPKEIILDTGKVDEDGSMGEESEESDEDSSDEIEVKPEVKTVEPLVIKQTSTGNECMKKSDQFKNTDSENVKREEIIHKNVTCENMGKGNIGLKLVFGVKSKPKLETQAPKQELSDSIQTTLTPPPPPVLLTIPPQEEPCKNTKVVKTEVVETPKQDLIHERLDVKQPQVKSEVVEVRDSGRRKETDISSLPADTSSIISKTKPIEPTKKKDKLQLKVKSDHELRNKIPIKNEVREIVDSEFVRKSEKHAPLVQSTKDVKALLDTKLEFPISGDTIKSDTASSTLQNVLEPKDTGEVQESVALNVILRKAENDKPVVEKEGCTQQPPHLDAPIKTDFKTLNTEVKVEQITSEAKDDTCADLPIPLLKKEVQQSDPVDFSTTTPVEERQTDSVPMDVDTPSHEISTAILPENLCLSDSKRQLEQAEVLKNADASKSEKLEIEKSTPKTDIIPEKDIRIPSKDVQSNLGNKVNLSVIAKDQKDGKDNIVSALTPEVVAAHPPTISESNFTLSNLSQETAISCSSVSKNSANLSVSPPPPPKDDCNTKSVSEENANSSIACKQNPSLRIVDSNTSSESKQSDTLAVTSTAKANVTVGDPKSTKIKEDPRKEDSPSRIENVTSSIKPEDVSVVEEPLTKTKAWVCGDSKVPPVVEEKITKNTAWVCGTAEPTDLEKVSVHKEKQTEMLTTTLKQTPVLTKTEADVSSEDTAAANLSKSSLVLYSESSEGSDAGDDIEFASSKKPERSESANKEHTDDSNTKASSSEKRKIDLEKTLTQPATKHSNIEETIEQKDKLKLNELSDNRVSENPAINDLTDANTIAVSEEHVKEDLKSEKCAESDSLKQNLNLVVVPAKVETVTSNESTNVEMQDDKGNKEKSLDLSVSTDHNKDSSDAAKAIPTLDQTKTTSTTSKEEVNSELDSSKTTMLPPSVPVSAANESVRDETSGKRKPEEELESMSKAPRLDIKESPDTVPSSPVAVSFNPIVGETIEEEVMTIVGEGSGAMNEGSNENSPASLVAEIAGSNDESDESGEEESRGTFPSRGRRAGRRGRGRRGRPVGGGVRRNSQSTKTPRSANRGMREVARLGAPVDSFEVNGDRENERPVRASRRIAQIRLKEEEERRKLEEERLAQLKAAQLQKKAKQTTPKDPTKESIGSQKSSSVPKIKKGNGRKPLKDQLKFHGKDYLPSGTESEDNSDEGDASDYDGTGKVTKKKKRRKNGKAPKKGGNPWATSSDEEEEEAVEEEEEYHYEEEEEELVFKSDHEFSPESDLGEDDGVGPSRHARTAKQDKGDKLFEEGNCCKCGKGDHPEWILLCDKCDKGWHASCLRPQLWVIPEGEWFCPPCQHNMLIENLSKNLVEYEVLLKKRENDILRKQRLAYVGISLNNVLPDKEKEEPEKVEKEEVDKYSHDRERHRKQRRRILSDEDDELSDDFINDRSDGDISRSRSNSSEDSEDGPVYRLRARRTKKAFDFKEYDDMINSALRVDDDDEEVEEEKGEDVEKEPEEGAQVNGDSKEAESGGKNDAFLKHLEEQAHEEEETDEELLDEKERLRRKELKKSCHRKTKRRINDLDAYSDEDSDDDFQASEAEDDEEEEREEGESEWSGDKMEEDSDDSIAKRARRKERHGRLGRREKYSDKGLVRRSTRKRKSRISYDESDEDDDEDEDQADKWQSEESEAEESESNSESDDSTWGKRKKKAVVPPKSKVPNFLLEASSNSNKGKGKGGVKRKKRKADDDDVDKAWNSARGRKQKDEPIERRTRGRKINFKDILDSGESDDDGNVRPKRRPLSDSDDSRSPSSSRKLAEEIRAENARQAKEYEASQAKKTEGTTGVEDSDASLISPAVSSDPPILPKLLESNIENNIVASPKLATSPSQLPVVVVPAASPIGSPMVSSPASLPPSSSPLITVPISSPLPLTSSPIVIPVTASPVPKLSASSPSSIISTPPPVPFVPKTQSIPPPPPIVLPKSPPPPITFPSTVGVLNLLLTPPPKPVVLPASQQVPVPSPVSERKSKSKGSRGSRGSSKSDKPPPPQISDLELALTKPAKTPPALAKSSSKKRDSAHINVPNANLLLAGGVLPEILSQGLGIPSQSRSGVPASPAPGSTSSSSSKKGSNANSALNQPHGKSSSSSSSSSSRPPNSSQQTTPPPISQNLSPSMPIDIDRVPNPALFQGNPGMRPFHPMWVRNPGPPPPAYTTAGSPMHGKPPPLNTSPFPLQQGLPPRPGYPSPPPLRIPNPNTSPLQAFQHFKRDNPIGGPLYRLPPGQPQPGVPLPNILPPGMMSPHSGVPERFFGAPSPYGHPYALLPPHSQGQHPQPIFGSPYDYRPPEPRFKEEPAPPPRNSSGSIPTPVSSASSSPPPTTSTVPSTTKDEASAARDSEFGGLVSYFSSQRSEEDMDT